MPKVPADYSKGFIYKLCCLDVNVKEIYIGSSTNFKQRKSNHKTNCNNEKRKEYNRYVYKFIRDNGSWSNWCMIELHKYSCNDRRELESEENRVMNELQSQLNSRKSYRTEEEQVEYQKEYDKKYREEHKEEIKIKNQIHYQTHKEARLEEQKNYRLEHREMINMKHKEKIVCDNCGVITRKYAISRHKKSKKCLNFKNET
tara:strand:+ start:537 stop:1139 length:603 start_codon:yes stop_codon:yes gene_type:complete